MENPKENVLSPFAKGEVERCSVCFQIFYKNELWHHKNKSSCPLPLFFCRKCLNEADAKNHEEASDNFELSIVTNWNKYNKYGADRDANWVYPDRGRLR